MQLYLRLMIGTLSVRTKCISATEGLWVRIVVFNTTFNNISVISSATTKIWSALLFSFGGVLPVPFFLLCFFGGRVVRLFVYLVCFVFFFLFFVFFCFFFCFRGVGANLFIRWGFFFIYFSFYNYNYFE